VRSGLLEFLAVTGVGCHWDTVTSMLFSKTLLKKVGVFRTDLGNAADRIWRWKALLYSDVAYVPEKLSTWRMHDAQSTANRKLVEPSWYKDRLLELLNESEDILPENWREEPRWKDKILHHFRKEELKAYGLNRDRLRSDPAGFVKGCINALVNDPKYLKHRLGNGLSWDDPLLEDEVGFTKRVAEDWNVPWPEREV